MRLVTRLFLSTALALSWTGLAAAEETLDLEPQIQLDFAGLTQVQLDGAIERLASRDERAVLKRPSGPTRMACQGGGAASDPETCTVTASDASKTSVPAALAAP
jgi:hypothetical protein